MSMPETIALEHPAADRLELATYSPDMAAELWAYSQVIADPAVGLLQPSERDLARWVEAYPRFIAEQIYAPYFIRTAEDEVLGMVDLSDHRGPIADANYGILPAARRQGLARTALQSLMQAGQLHWGLQEVRFDIAEVNTPSQRVVQSVGAVRSSLGSMTHSNGQIVNTWSKVL